jgi:cyanophycinase
MTRRIPGRILCLAFASLLIHTTRADLAAQSSLDQAAGPLVIVGGGGTPQIVLSKILELAGGKSAKIVILPQASSRENRGEAAEQMFRDQGARQVEIVEFDDRIAAREKINSADLIWFPGGSQQRLFDALTAADLAETIRRKHQSGAVVGGTSAGAAIMSQAMIPSSPKVQGLKRGNTPIVPGLGLCPKLIIDQHFVERQRIVRLLSAVIDHPQKIGVGISERTAIIVHSDKFVVMGKGSVVVVDPTQADVTKGQKESLQSARRIRVDVLASGDRFDLEVP